MSLFNRKAKTEPIKREEKFSIFQFVKVEGLRTDKKEKFVPTEFISPILELPLKMRRLRHTLMLIQVIKLNNMTLLETNQKAI